MCSELVKHSLRVWLPGWWFIVPYRDQNPGSHQDLHFNRGKMLSWQGNLCAHLGIEWCVSYIYLGESALANLRAYRDPRKALESSSMALHVV